MKTKRLVNVKLISLILLITFLLCAVLTAETELEQAYDMYKNGNYQEALEETQQLVEEDPNYAGAVFLLGRIHFALGNLEKANQYIKKAIELDNTNPQFREVSKEMSSYASKISEAGKLMNSGKYEEAIKLYQELINENPNYSPAYFNLGRAYIQIDQVAEGARYLKKSIDMNPEETKWQEAYQNFVRQMLYQGNQYMSRRNYDQARKKFKQALMLDSTEVYGYYLSALTYLYERNYDQALKYIDKTIQHNPKYQKAYLVKGKIHLRQNQNQKALEAFNQAVEIDPDYTDAWSNIGYVHYNNKDYDEAIPAYKKVIKLEPDNKVAFSNLGAIYFKKKAFEKAIEHLNRAVELKPDDYMSWYRLAEAYNEIGQAKKAKNAAESALKYRSNLGGALYELGIAELRLGNKSAAKEAFKLAARDPSWKKIAEFQLKKLQ